MSSKERVRLRIPRPAAPKRTEEDRVHALPALAPPLTRFASLALGDESASSFPMPELALSKPTDLAPKSENGAPDKKEVQDQKEGQGPAQNPQEKQEEQKDKKGAGKLPSYFAFADRIAQFKLIPKDLPPGEFNEEQSSVTEVREPELENHEFEATAAPEPAKLPEQASEEVKSKADAEAQSATPKEVGNDKPKAEVKMPDPKRGAAPEAPATKSPSKPARRTASNGIPDSVRAKMESVFNIDVSSVKIVENSSSAKAAGALAYAAGDTLHFAPGQFSPGTPQGQQLLGHEMAHLVQQKQGRVQATGEMGGMAINNDHALEAEADAMANQLLSTQEASAEGAESAAAAPALSASNAPVSQLQDDGSNLYGSYQELLAWATEQKAKIATDTTTLKDAVTQLGTSQKQTISDLVDTQVQRMKDAIKTAQDHLRTTTSTARTTITTHRETKITEVNTTADTEIAGIQQLVDDKKKALIDKGETHATGIVTHAETQANRAITQSKTNSTQVNSVISTTANNYQDRDGVDQAVTEARNNASDLTSKFTEMGDTMATQVRGDATGMATDIRQEAIDAGSQFDKPLIDTTETINRKRNETIDALNGSGESLLTTLERETEESITALEQQIGTQDASLHAYADGTNETVDKAVNDSHTLIDEQMQNAGHDIDAFVQQLDAIGWYASEIEAAKADLEAALTAHRADIDAKKTEVTTSFEAHKGEVQTGTDELAGAIETTVTEICTNFDNEVNPKIEEVKGELDTMTTTATDEIKTVRPALEPELDKAVSDTEDKWSENIEAAESDISTKVDQGLERQQATLSDFSSQINEQFSSLPSKDRGFWESLWEGIKDVGAFIGGVFVGMFNGLVDMLKGIWEIIITPAKWLLAAVVIIVAVIVIAIIAAVAGISFGLAALIVGAIIGVGFMLYYFYKAATTEGLSPYERGKLVGRGLFEGLMAFAGTGVIGRLGSWVGRISKIGEMINAVGGLSKFLKMAVWVDDVDRLILLIRRVENIGELSSIFGKLSNGKDAAKLLDLIDHVGDVSKIASLLGEGANISKILNFVDDASKLASIMDKIGDVSTLTRLIEAGKLKNLTQLEGLITKIDDISRIEGLLNKVEDAAQLEKLLAAVGDDAAKLEAILGKVDDGAQMTRLLDQLGGDATKLEALLAKAGDGASAERFLQQLQVMEQKLLAAGITKVDDGSGIIRYLDATGKEVATMENFVMKYSYGGHGGEIIMDADRTTTILGKFQDPTLPGWGTEWVHNLPEGSFSRQGQNPGGLNMLDVDPVTWDKLLVEAGGDAALRNEIFWQRYNLPFLEESFKSGDLIRMLSNPSNPAARSGTFLRELQAIEGPAGLAQKYGYIWDAVSQSYRPGPRFAEIQETLRVVESYSGKIADVTEMGNLMGRVTDPAVLRSLMGKVDNGAQLTRLLDGVGGNVAELDRLLALTGDAAKLDTLLPKFADAAEFERILGKVENIGQLDSLMGMVKNPARLERLLGMTDDAFQLEYFITLSGGETNIHLLEEMLTLAGGSGNASKLQGLIDLTGSSASWFTRVAEAAKDFKRLPIPTPGWSARHSFQDVNWPHLFERHTYDWFTFADIKASQGFWPKGTTDAGLRVLLEEALDLLHAAGRLPTPNTPQVIALSSGMRVQVGMRMQAGVRIIGQFFPISGPGVVTLLKSEVEAILNIITP